MFRFYDLRVMAAFIMTLVPGEVTAFHGPIDQIAVMRGDTLTELQAQEEVVSDQFKDDLFRFYRKVFAAETETLGDDDLRGRLEQAIADTRRLGASREQDVLKMSAIRVLRPDLTDDDWVWNEVMTHETNNPKMRAALFLGHLKFAMGAEARDEFEAKLGLFGIPGVY